MTKTLSIPLYTRGKVRDVYDLGDRLLIVASDRLSAYDCVLPTEIPDKGVVLCRTSTFWFQRLASLCPHHLLATSLEEFPSDLRRSCAGLEGRAVVVRKAKRIDIECVVRGYLAGSGWSEYQRHQSVCGVKLPAGLVESSKLPEPIFTPATKAPDGEHDQNIDFDDMVRRVGRDRAERLRDVSLRIFRAAQDHAREKGFLLADTKFEFGEIDGRIVWIDEALTPDSSRFWDVAAYRPGGPQDSFDKQFVRDYLNRIQWNRQPPAPALPPEVVEKTREKYVTAYERLTGQSFNRVAGGVG